MHGNNQLQAKASQPTRGESRDFNWKQYLIEFEELKRYVLGSVLYLRRELEPVLLITMINLIRQLQNNKIMTKAGDFSKPISRLKSEFSNPGLIRDTTQIENVLLSISNINSEYEEIRKNVIEKFFKKYHIVYLSDFARECLFSYLRNRKLTILQCELGYMCKRENQPPQIQSNQQLIGHLGANNDSAITIKSLRDPIQEANYKNILIRSDIPADEFEKTVEIKPFPLREDVSMRNLLDNLVKKKREEVSSKSGQMGGVNAIENPEIPIPEMKLRKRIENAKNYVDRRILSETEEPSIIALTIKDGLERVSCVEIGRSSNIVLLGSMDSHITAYILNPDYLNQSPLSSFNQIFQDLFGGQKNKTSNSEAKGTTSDSKQNLEEIPRNKNQPPSNSMEIESKEESQSGLYCKFKGHESAVTSISLLYDELYFLSSSADAAIRLWCIRQKRCLVVYRAHINTVWNVKFGPKGYYFASGSSDCMVKLWVTDKLTPVRNFSGHTSDVIQVQFFDNCQYLISSGYDCIIRIWDIKTAACIKMMFHNQGELVTSIAITSCGLWMATGSEDGSVIFWDLVKGKRLRSLEHDEVQDPTRKNFKINSLDFTQDDSYLLCVSKSRISYFIVHKLKEELQSDAYVEFQHLETTDKAPKTADLIPPLNFFETSKPVEEFIFGKFNSLNFATVLSRSFD